METAMLNQLKDTDEFKKNKAAAWGYINGNCNFNIDDFPPEQYKYFDKLLQLYGKMKDGGISQEQAAAEDKKNYAELEEYFNKWLECVNCKHWFTENYKKTYAEIAEVERTTDMAEIVNYMADALGRMLGDVSFAPRQKKKFVDGDLHEMPV